MDMLSFHIFMKETNCGSVMIVYILCGVGGGWIGLGEALGVGFVLIVDGFGGSVVSRMAIILSYTHSSSARVAFCVVDLVIICRSSKDSTKFTVSSSVFVCFA